MTSASIVNTSAGLAKHLANVYSFLSVGLFTTAMVCHMVMANPGVLALLMTPWILISLIIAEFALVIYLASSSRRDNASFFSDFVSFLIFSGLNGLTLTPFVMMYTGESVASAFFVTTGTVVAMSIVGYTTKKDLSGMGTFFLGALIGLIIVMIANTFIASSGLAILISCFAVLLFTGLIAYDTQRIKDLYRPGMESSDYGMRLAVSGALDIYLDFINLFIHLLRLFGNLSDD
jgi:uncharacterized protein